ncbi:glycoside hydrolase family 3 C-terminal domain-containing protein [Caulobacter sp. DWP3-1-3b2]|uniref:glycoside hydrolase family 3 C-terminal domain-containing protein n=1 Tax=Caulobacter sp. DWP3-1-3b2 TaxID=2804643 RepID=UPI003CE6A5C6
MNRQSVQGLALALMLGVSIAAVSQAAQAQTAAAYPATQPWLDASLDPDARADLALKAMTQDEKMTIIFGFFGSEMAPKYTRVPQALPGSAGYVPGIARLGVPAQFQTDAGVGVATQGGEPKKRERTALPSGMATTATWNPDLAFKGGAMIGSEARDSGFNVMLAGGVNLVREPRNGRNFEYGGEDPLLAGRMVGAQIKGIQSNAIVSTIKHYAVNGQETGRFVLDSKIGEADARTSDLLAFQFAIEDADPHSVMCSYNRLNGDYACENDFLLNKVLKQDWGFKNYVMSDWGAVHSSAKAINAGLDQESAGQAFDKQNFFQGPLKDALTKGEVSQARLDDMARRILRGLFASGVVEKPVKIAAIDYAAHAKVTQADAEEGIVLLKNDKGLLPLAASAKKIAVIGGHADVGVLSGGGSSQVYPIGGRAVTGEGPASWPGPMIYFPSSPLKGLKARLPGAEIRYADGKDLAAAAKLAADSDVVLVFATQWNGESFDSPLTLENNQDALIDAVASANTRTVVVLETGGPVLMPWLPKVGGVVEAWYPGSAGGEAIARVLTGEVDASGRLPVTFPAALAQLPRPVLDGDPKKPDDSFPVDYTIEGAAVGYKWFDKQGHQPLFAFGHGLSYTSFAYDNLKATSKDGVVTVSFDVKNTGPRAGKAVPQVYVSPKAGGWEAPQRLAAFSKVDLAPGATTSVTLAVDPRLLATWDSKAHGWSVAAGNYTFTLGASSRDTAAKVDVAVAAKAIPVGLMKPR